MTLAISYIQRSHIRAGNRVTKQTSAPSPEPRLGRVATAGKKYGDWIQIAMLTVNSEEGHMAKECDKPKNPANSTCRNCEEVGHFSKDCPKPRDWSKWVIRSRDVLKPTRKAVPTVEAAMIGELLAEPMPEPMPEPEVVVDLAGIMPEQVVDLAGIPPEVERTLLAHGEMLRLRLLRLPQVDGSWD
ncbi:MAG: hypothetical protein Q9226_002127 [Calogaya cf. arnoldii]